MSDLQDQWIQAERKELAVLRSECERLQIHLRTEEIMHDHTKARAEKAEADNAALRDGLELIRSKTVQLGYDSGYPVVAQIADKLLASPDPGAKVRALIAAVEDRLIALEADGYQEITDAVRALRGKEGEGDVSS